MGERGGETISDEAKQTWERVGPLRLHELAKNTTIEIDFELGYHQSLFRLAIDGSPLKVYGQARFYNGKSIQDEGYSRTRKVKNKANRQERLLEDYMQILNSQETLNLKEIQSQALATHSKQWVHKDQDVEQTFGNNISIQNEQSFRRARDDPHLTSGYGDQSSNGGRRYTEHEHLATMQQSQTLQFKTPTTDRAQLNTNIRYLNTHAPSVIELDPTKSKETIGNPNVLIIGSNQDYGKHMSENNYGKSTKKAVNSGICRIIKDAQFCVTPLKEHIYEGQVNDQMQPHGFGRQIYRNGDVYTGQWLNGIKHGIGRYVEYDAY